MSTFFMSVWGSETIIWVSEKGLLPAKHRLELSLQARPHTKSLCFVSLISSSSSQMINDLTKLSLLSSRICHDWLRWLVKDLISWENEKKWLDEIRRRIRMKTTYQTETDKLLDHFLGFSIHHLIYQGNI